MASANTPSFELDSVNARPLQLPAKLKPENNNFNGSNAATKLSKLPVVTLQAVSSKLSSTLEAQQHDPQQIDKEHQIRHKQRARIARGIQRLLTAIISTVVAVIQGSTYIIYQQTAKNPGAWPSFVNIVPTLMLFATAVMATAIDLCAIVAYAWPQTRAGNMAFKECHLASQAHYVTTSIKTISYTHSTIICRTSFNQGNNSEQNNDLWGWAFGGKADAAGGASQASSNCLGNAIVWALAIANICVEVLGLLIHQVVKRDEARWKNETPATDDGSDVKPLLSSSADQGFSEAKNQKQRYSRVTEEEFDELDKRKDDIDQDLRTQLPSMDLQQPSK